MSRFHCGSQRVKMSHFSETLFSTELYLCGTSQSDSQLRLLNLRLKAFFFLAMNWIQIFTLGAYVDGKRFVRIAGTLLWHEQH